ncbi:5,10-methylenetetrahydrofolate reductase (NAD(P)) [Raineyella antarctica]|uniref:Methylenetetrahydrofolate reductase n=1 Tax=Raineyella antarctica TaxID=1577474 RepID=A0A1G6GDR9_9ACTN|nr:methylenetetrahydrofolate reductase [Raineyella antarctica]SDB80141.1 5,10-methylenetetrahydrofolate reductase (NAD(P)) [Raineyella antarctica]
MSPRTIDELLRAGDRPLHSFEFFPPKTLEGDAMLWKALMELDELAPDFVSVTYGANGSRRDMTVTITARLAQLMNERRARDPQARVMQVMGHLTCVNQPVDQLAEVIDEYAAAGIDHILAIRGDMPGGPTVPWVRHPQGLENATELVRLVRRRHPRAVIGVAAFPDLHPDRRDAALDARILVEKQEAGASFAITQLFFEPYRYFELVERVRALGSDLPIIPGIQPVTNVGQIQRFAELSGAPLPDAVVARLTGVADDPEAVRRVGVDIGVELSRELLAGGAPGLHYYTLNRSRATREIYSRLKAEVLQD